MSFSSSFLLHSFFGSKESLYLFALCGRRLWKIRREGEVSRKVIRSKLNSYQNVISTSSPPRTVAAGPRIELPIPPALTPPETPPPPGPLPSNRPSMAGGYVTTSASARWSISDVKGSSGFRLRASWYESMAPSRSPSRCLARPRAEYPAWLPCFGGSLQSQERSER